MEHFTPVPNRFSWFINFQRETSLINYTTYTYHTHMHMYNNTQSTSLYIDEMNK